MSVRRGSLIDLSCLTDIHSFVNSNRFSFFVNSFSSLLNKIHIYLVASTRSSEILREVSSEILKGSSHVGHAKSSHDMQSL